MAEPAVETRGLRKRFGDVTALDGLDLEVPVGSFFGLLGPNGAGKTTAVSILCTLLRPDGGEARVLGFDLGRDRAEVRSRIGIVFQEPCLDTELSTRENLDIHARLYHLDRRAERVDRALERLGIRELADRGVGTLSGGLRRRAEIARALCADPRVLFLDEPTVGLDVPSRRALWAHLEQLRARGERTVVLTTHAMDEAAHLCDAVAIVDAGRVVARGSPAELCRALGGDRVEIELARPVEECPDVPARLEALERVRSVHAEGVLLRITAAHGAEELAALVDAARPGGIRSVRLREANLEDAFLHFTGHTLGEPDP